MVTKWEGREIVTKRVISVNMRNPDGSSMDQLGHAPEILPLINRFPLAKLKITAELFQC